ncbi:MAG TPA: ATP-binding protein [Candidatus Acidoferrales bacterium]|nr:ATP-binding protein [Candidatus Acidoferrales bacterium]
MDRRKLYERRRPELPGISSAVARGASEEDLIKIAAPGLLCVGHAERAGVWLAPQGQAVQWNGRVEDRNQDVVPPEWSRLDPSLPFLQPLLESGTPVLQNLNGRGSPAIFGPLLGMKHALWTPLRLGTRTFGIALTAWSQWHTYDGEDLQKVADDLSLALAQRAAAELCRVQSHELSFRSQIQKNIHAGAPAKHTLEMIARKAVESAGCVFFELGICLEGKLTFEIFDGIPEAKRCAQDEPFLHIWKKALEDRRTIGTSVTARDAQAMPEHFLSRNTPLRVVAVPLLDAGEILGVVLGGVVNGLESLANLERLESYAALAATVLFADSRRRWESALRASQANRFEATFETVLLVGQDGVVQKASPSARKMLGQNAAGVGHLRLEDFFEGVNRPAIAAWRRALPAKGSVDVAEGTLPNGRKVRLQNRGALPFPETTVLELEIAIEDISAKELEGSPPERARIELEALLDSLEAGVVIFDAAGTIRRVNQRFGDLFGLDPAHLGELGTAQALAAKLKDCFSNSEKYAARWRDLFSGGPAGRVEELELDRPTPRVLERFVRPVFDQKGNRIGSLEIYRDLTAQKLTHAKLQQTGKLAALGRMASDLAHELNNPLTSILGYAQLLLDRSRATDKASDLRKIYREAERANRITKNLLLFARETRPERSLVDLNEIVRSTASLRRYELKLENIGLDTDLDPNLPKVLSDAGQMQQVVLNLIVNAEQAIHQARASGHIRIRTAKLSEDRVLLEVADDGPGIPPQIAAHIFDPFFTTKPVGQGTGLGLSIAKGIVEEYEGTVRLASSTGSGATFQVELPAGQAAPPSRQKPRLTSVPQRRSEPVSRPAARGVEPRGPGRRVLVVEDEPTVAQLIADVLREEGYQVEVLLDSREGFELAQRQSFDLLICDLKMPQLDGRAFYAALEGSGNPLRYHILFVTGDTLAPHTMEFLETHHLPYLAKPFLVEELKQAVERAFQSRAANAHAAGGAAASGWAGEPAREK